MVIIQIYSAKKLGELNFDAHNVSRVIELYFKNIARDNDLGAISIHFIEPGKYSRLLFDLEIIIFAKDFLDRKKIIAKLECNMPKHIDGYAWAKERKKHKVKIIYMPLNS